MSLASRISNLFSGSSEHTKLGRGDDGVADEGLLFADNRQRICEREKDTMAPKNDAEEGRPPYLHVCLRQRQTDDEALADKC